jgi:Contractile injection system tube protein
VTTAIALAGSNGQVGTPGGSGAVSEVPGRPSMKKAMLSVYAPKPAPGGYQPGSKTGDIDFQFNPKEVTIAKSAKWERKPAKGSKSAPPPEFTGSDPCKLTVEMFFDATGSSDGSVLEVVEKLFNCCVPTEQSSGQKKPTPPLVVLQWGSISSFPAVITSVSVKYTLFRHDGTPLRAICSVSMEEMPGSPPRQNPTSGSDTIRRVHRTIVGDTLASIAYAEYGDPTHWRPLAAYNGIDDPLRLPTGRTILLPSLEEMGVTG